MQPEIATAPVSKKMLWAGRILTALPALFLLFDSAGKLMKVAPVVEGTTQLGYAESVILPLGIVLLGCTVVHLIPRTAMLGAILLTGYLGGAVATHVRVGSPFLTHVLFPVYIAVLVWGGLYLRDERLRAVVQSGTQSAAASKKILWAGRVVSALPVLMLLMSAGMKFAKGPEVVDGLAKFGYPESAVLGIGIAELACTIIYVIPRTSVLGAILLVGYLGGATATHVRIGDMFLAPIIAGVLVWAGLYLRDPRVRALVPLRKSP